MINITSARSIVKYSNTIQDITLLYNVSHFGLLRKLN